MKTVIILFGGKSSEYEVSLSSATGAYNNIDKEKYDVKLVGITRDGRFFLYDDDPSLIAEDKWTNGRKYPVSLDLSRGVLTYVKDGKTEDLPADAVLPMIHGKFCEDGTLQGMFAVADIPIVGCDCQSSAVCMDKVVTKSIVAVNSDVKLAKMVVVKAADVTDDASVDAIREKCEKKLGYPVFVKPSRAGSSVGVSKVKSADTFADALRKALHEDDKVLIEEAIESIGEIEVAVLEEHGKYTVGGPAQIDRGSAEFYDYETKYISDASSFYLPARISEALQKTVREYAEMIFKILDCKGFARVDFFCTADGELIFNEINTLPGFTPISMFPKMMINEGISYPDVIDRLIKTVLR